MIRVVCQYHTKCEIPPHDHLRFPDRSVDLFLSLSFRLPFPLVTDIIDSSDDKGHVEPPTTVGLHDLDIGEIIGSEKYGNRRFLGWSNEDK